MLKLRTQDELAQDGHSGNRVLALDGRLLITTVVEDFIVYAQDLVASLMCCGLRAKTSDPSPESTCSVILEASSESVECFAGEEIQVRQTWLYRLSNGKAESYSLIQSDMVACSLAKGQRFAVNDQE